MTLDEVWLAHKASHIDTDTLTVEVSKWIHARIYDQDAAQEIILGVWRAIQKGRVRTHTLSHYLNHAISLKKISMGIRQKAEIQRSSEIVPDAVTFDSDAVTFTDLSRLPEDIRTIAEAMAQGYSLAEIARQQGLSKSGIRMKVTRYRNNLK